MNILFCSLFLPHPQADHAVAFTGYNLLRHLSCQHDITLLAFVRSVAESRKADCLRNYCRRVETVLMPSGFRASLRSRVKLLCGTPIVVAQTYSHEMSRALSRLCASERFDVLHFEYSPMGQYLTDTGGSCKVRAMNVHDLIASQARTRAAHLPSSRRKLECWLDALVARRYEQRLYSRFDVVFTCAKGIRDELLAALPDLKAVYLPFGVDLASTPKAHSGPGRHLLFVGAMWRHENIDAVLFFYHQIFRRICTRVPNATLSIVGGSPVEAVRQLAADPHVQVTGYVKELLPCYLASDVSIAPVRIAGGVLCKILDAMAAGLPVVTTPAGNDGVGAQPSKEILVADTPDEFAAHTVSLLESPQLRNELSRRGREFVRQNYSWKTIVARLEDTYDRLLGRGGNDATPWNRR